MLCCARDQGSAGRKRLSVGVIQRVSGLFTVTKSGTQATLGLFELP